MIKTHFSVDLLDREAQRKPEVDGRGTVHLVCAPKHSFSQLKTQDVRLQVDLLRIAVISKFDALTQRKAREIPVQDRQSLLVGCSLLN
jgi:hypothetical protein